jgi:hypothetical protein
MRSFIPGIIDHHEAAAAETGGGLIHNRQRKGGGNGSIHRIAAAVEDLHASLGGQLVIRNDETHAALLGIIGTRPDKEKSEEENDWQELRSEKHRQEILNSLNL